MQIDGIGGAGAVTGFTPARRRQTGFAVPDAAEATQVAEPAEAACAAAMQMVTLPGDAPVATHDGADQAAAGQGDAMLGAMRGLQLAMLGGGSAQAELAKLAESLPEATDPALHDVLRAIAQRAAVERARRE